MQQVVVARESRKKADMALQQEHKERDMAERKALEEGLRRAQAERRAHEESVQRAAAEQRELDAQVRSSIEKHMLKDTEHARRLWVAESQRLEVLLLQASEAKRRLGGDRSSECIGIIIDDDGGSASGTAGATRAGGDRHIGKEPQAAPERAPPCHAQFQQQASHRQDL